MVRQSRSTIHWNTMYTGNGQHTFIIKPSNTTFDITIELNIIALFRLNRYSHSRFIGFSLLFWLTKQQQQQQFKQQEDLFPIFTCCYYLLILFQLYIISYQLSPSTKSRFGNTYLLMYERPARTFCFMWI